MKNTIKLILGNLIIFAILFELIAIVATRVFHVAPTPELFKKTVSKKEPPKHKDTLAFNLFNTPNSTSINEGACFNIIESYNSYGIRDRDREKKSSKVRVLNFGDSFIKGYGIDTSFRLSNILEKKLSTEILNFGQAGFASTQMYYAYEKFAHEFSHEILLIGLFPGNDLMDDNYELMKELEAGHKKPWPYLKKKENGYEITYIDKKSNVIKKEKGYFASIIDKTHSGQLGKKILSKIKARLGITTKYNKEFFSRGSSFETIYDKEVAVYKYNILKFKETEKKIILFTIPSLLEFRTYYDNPSFKDNLSPELAKFCSENQIQFINLFQHLINSYSQTEIEEMFLCDGHWSEKGHKTTAEILYPYLQKAIAEK